MCNKMKLALERLTKIKLRRPRCMAARAATTHEANAAPASSKKKAGGLKTTVLRIVGALAPKQDRQPKCASSTASSDSARKDGNGCKRVDGEWGPVRNIPDAALVRLAIDYAASTLHDPALTLADAADVKVITRTSGSNNAAYIVQYKEDLKVCIRVPACGWGNRWTARDADALRTIALTMRYIRNNTGHPLPEVLAYDRTFNNPIGAPYILMTCVEGREVREVWNDKAGPIPREEKRQNILRSLACAMAELKPLQFDKMGALEFDRGDEQNPRVGSTYDANFGHDRDDGFDPEEHFTVPQPNAQAFFRTMFRTCKDYDLTENPQLRDPLQPTGLYRLYEMLVDEIPWPEKANEDPGEFVLAPPDFDWYNMMADDHGNITSILDWDRTETWPRFLGWSRLPGFLCVDWLEGLDWPRGKLQDMDGSALDSYREAYAKYLAQACGEQRDCRYTAKSHLWWSILHSMGKWGEMNDLLDRVLAEAMPRVRRHGLICNIGAFGLEPEEEERIRGAFKSLLAP